ncbi:Dihydroorotate dehydrogenase B (NAD(+)), electron transfer subunit [Caloramator mitchellensis]|uniref:Dihydroorotate dehydrogenase B (NAD(+)), electron transfer subunit n=1 Tax=Caloramator mitchellensis TaxID=908809 RepID=A0A0R3JTF0_CALMK|nr:sulfide/dihydroorotate dehydrogenase-like FAD/NAD-binding protein [Caloramator mitchellensis]KRQ86800.1 Dihydroorotate dehydrogenase B (NAD(+)), electron transfer subunit [Caloramator mitchellensis]
MFRYIDCIDAGTEFCPCNLADTGECIICSQLRGKTFCDCLNWKGSCIFQEYYWNHNKSKKVREFAEYVVVDKKYIRDDLIKFDIQVNAHLARQLNSIGSYVFLKNPKSPEFFSTPISIMKSNLKNNQITVVVKIIGVKTKNLGLAGDKILLKGPYWNGIQGQVFLKGLKNSTLFIAARGVAAAPALMVAKKLKLKGNEIIVALDVGRHSENFAKKDFTDLGCKIIDVSMVDYSKYSLKEEFIKIIAELKKKYEFKVILSAGSDEFHELLLNHLYQFDNSLKFATVNNGIITCGEGVCGSCEAKLHNHLIKTCKQQYNPAELFIKPKGEV